MAQVLIIDDEQLSLYVMREVLEAAGHRVIEAVDGRAGMALQAKYRCPLVITDMIMPEQEGATTIAAIKRDFPETRVIAVSGSGEGDEKGILNLATRMGADAVLAKPFTEIDLMDAVRVCLEDVSPPATPD